MAIDFGTLRAAARRERARTFNPEEAPPHGDFPYLDVHALDDLDCDANYSLARMVWTALVIGVVVILFAGVAILLWLASMLIGV